MTVRSVLIVQIIGDTSQKERMGRKERERREREREKRRERERREGEREEREREREMRERERERGREHCLIFHFPVYKMAVDDKVTTIMPSFFFDQNEKKNFYSAHVMH